MLLSSAHSRLFALCSTLPSLRPYSIGDELLAIGAKIAVRVLEQPEVRRLRDEHAAVEHLQPARQDEAVLKNGALVHAAVVVRVFEHDDLADRLVLAFRVDVGHVARHLDHPHAAFAVPVDHDRVLNQRLAGDELDAIAGRHGELLERLLRRQRRRVFGHLLKSRRPGFVTCAA